MFGPLNKRKDGTFVFASPIGNGHVPMIALPDLGYFARYTFDHREETSGKDLEVASEMVQWSELVKTFQKVTGNKAEYKPVSLDEWFAIPFTVIGRWSSGVDSPGRNQVRILR